MALQSNQRAKLDESDDQLFYSTPRLVTHVDEGFITQLMDLYRQRLRPHSRILDLMSSWVSHLPQEMAFEWVEGHGLNAEELQQNPQLDHYFVQNLNETPHLPLADTSFDAVLNAVSVQYLQYPEQVFAQMYRVLRPGGVAIVSFSNRMFYQKAIAAWRENSEAGRVELVKRYFNSVPGFGTPDVIARPANLPMFLQLMGFPSTDPFYAVVAERLESSA
ncbi:Biotin biosynthesis bifunctional protein BioHC [Halomicronema hongdechloris C2206]|uniref:Biotin biosynthesis bifunctional protein BioHC n=1 Tax=Halomicronema hongdechloris C2206 TaxID=1641165 RepID=A0A1Z3HJS6_9CYAN|nr:class I SAM-dependent methyltransferase [Halomicronema hongdechloris]ASC70574.1 Biotin biosynthesis bifunctional protein BioHC [Halomicronema hongdechloris C2206]